MACYLIEPRDQIFIKKYGFFPFYKKNINKNWSKNASGKYSQSFFIMLKDLLQIYLKLNKKE